MLPKNLATLVGMVQTVMQHLGMDGVATRSGLHGAGIGTTSVRGIARVATTPEQALDVLEPGDILVVAGTTPAYNLVLSLAGGVVTAEGGPMSHAAVIARELGIPAVVGARTALVDIPDGAMVEVDPVAGEVRVLTTRPDSAPCESCRACVQSSFIAHGGPEVLTIEEVDDPVPRPGRGADRHRRDGVEPRRPAAADGPVPRPAADGEPEIPGMEFAGTVRRSASGSPCGSPAIE